MSFPNITFWSHLLATVGVEVCGVAALGFVAQLFFRSAVWQRAIWQMTAICLLLLPASEWTGFGRGAARFLLGHKPLVEHTPASVFTTVTAAPAVGRIMSRWQIPSARVRPPLWWPAWVWLAGAVVVLGRMAAAQILLLTLRLRREKITSQSLRERVAFVARSVGLRRKVNLLRMPESISPMAFGIVRPSIGLPPGFETKLSATEQEAVLAHELAHLAAMDPLWFMLADFASAWLWWHPLAWWVRRSLHGASELAADEATALLPEGPGALANCLVSLGKEMTAGRGWSWVGINGGFRSKLGQRVERLMRMSGGARAPLAGWAGAAAKLAVMMLVVPTIVVLLGFFQSAQGQKQDSWRGQLRDSWNSSSGALLVLAALDDKAEQKGDIAKRIQNAKLLYEMGKIGEAEVILVQVIKDDPSNRSAPYYLDLIKEVRYMDNVRRQEEGLERLPDPSPLGTNPVHATKGRQRILSKLDTIIINEVSFNLPLKDVLQKLSIESQKHDPDGIGVNFMIHQDGRDPATFSTAATGASPAAATMQSKDIGIDVRIKISPPLRNFRLADVLDAITKGADSPIRYTIEDYAVVFSPKPAETTPGLSLYTKTFRVDSKRFLRGLANVTSSEQQLQTDPLGLQIGSGYTNRTNSTMDPYQMVEAYFASAGVNLAPPKLVFFNDRLGEIMVRATQQDLEIIQQAIESLNQPQPPADPLLTRVFKVDPNVFVEGLANVSVVNLHPSSRSAGGNDGGGASSGGTIPSEPSQPGAQKGGRAGVNEAAGANSKRDIPLTLRNFIIASGVDLSDPGKAVVFDARTGSLVVSATASDMEKVEHVVEALNRTPPQVTIEAIFVELSPKERSGLGGYRDLGGALTNNSAMSLRRGAVSSSQSASNQANPSGIFPGAGTDAVASSGVNGILSDAEFRTILIAMKHRAGNHIILLTKVTTESGRKAHLGATDGNNAVGLEVMAEVGPDGFSIRTTAIASVKNSNQHWQFSASHRIWDGQTLVFSEVMTNQIPGATKEGMVFVTPTIIDPAGNRVHADEVVSKLPGIPNQ